MPPDTATTLRLDRGEPLVTDGPFVEGKEVVSGYAEIEAADLNEAPCAKQNRARDAERPGLRARSGLGCGVAGASLTGRRITRLPSLSACNKAGLGTTPRLSPRCVASRRTAIISAMRVKAPESNTPGLYGP